MKLIGILLILISITFAAWHITTKSTHNYFIITLCLISVFAGLALILQDRATELTVKGIGTIKAATQQAQSDAKTIAELTERVENQSAIVALVAKDASKAKEISEEVADKNRRAEEKLNTLDEAITKANTALADLETATEFTMTVVAAQNDDRKAFDKLKEWSKEKNYRFSSRAAQAWNTIFENHNKPFFFSDLTVPWIEGIVPSNLSLPELAKQYRKAPTQLKPALLEYIWKRDDIPKIERLDFMMYVIKHDSSLTAVEYAGRHFTSGTNQKIKPMAVEYLADWWEKHKQEFQQK